VWLLVDAAIWFAAAYGATWLRYDFQDPVTLGGSTLVFAVASALTYLIIGAVIGPYSVGHKRGSFEETTELAGP
jgi:hypothetical protein